jgi:hypothetical protein
MQIGFQRDEHGEIGSVAREKVVKAWWNWHLPLMTHPFLNYIPGFTLNHTADLT